MQAWQEFLTALESDLGAATVDRWLKPLKIVHFDAGNLYIEACDSFQVSWFEEHIRAIARKKFVNNNHNPIKIHLSGPSSPLPPKGEERTKSTSTLSEKRPTISLTKDALDPSATLENFLTSDRNKMAIGLLSSLLGQKSQAAQYNPIYLYGASGTGKSHLLMALTKAMQTNGIKALYVKMETFTENVVAAIRTGNMNDFRQMYREIDTLIVDDVQILAKKTATQEEFFHTFNTLHTSGRQIILSANCPPFMLCDIEPRLVSRFEWGITLPLGSMENEEIEKIVYRRLSEVGLKIENETLNHLLSSFSYHLSSLHKAVDALALRADASKSELSIQKINTLLSDLLKEKQSHEVTPQKIVQAVADYYGIKTEDILGRSQTQEYTVARQVAMYLCREKIKAPFTKIGQYFQRDHSTVISSVNLIKEKLLKKELSLPADLKSIENKLGE